MRPSLSLPFRLSLAVMAVLVAVTVAADLMAMRELRRRLAASAADSLSGMIARLGRQMDGDLAVLADLLADEARTVADLSPEEARQALARSDEALRFAFDYGVVMVDASGKVVADSRARSFWEGIDVSGQEFFQRSFALRRPLVSEPFASPGDGRTPIVVLTVPLRDDSGRMRALLAGALDLVNNRILSHPTGVRASRHGQIGVFTLDGRVVAHTDASLILDAFENPLPGLDLAVGSPVSMTIVSADGVPAILAAARLERADWLIAGVFPAEEIYRPIEQGFTAAHRWFAGGLALCCLMVLAVSRRTVRDLGLLAREVETVGLDRADPPRPHVGGGYRGEAGMLAAAINAMLDSLAEARRDIDDLSARLAGAGERERRTIAAGLHDSVCQTLALANMRLGGLKKRCPDAAAGGDLDNIRALLEQSVGELKTLIFDLSPGILYELGLTPALEWFAGVFEKKYGLPVVVAGEGDAGGLDDEQAIFLYRAAGELLTNAAKHAGASTARVRVVGGPDGVVLEVADDGRGMAAGDAEGDGFGLRDLRARARQMGGDFSLHPAPGGGTLARLRLPVPSTPHVKA